MFVGKSGSDIAIIVYIESMNFIGTYDEIQKTAE